MSESKLCPMKFGGELFDRRGPLPRPNWNEDCVQEKCAWWVKKIRLSEHVNVQTGYRPEFDAGSHCVILDLGKGRLT